MSAKTLTEMVALLKPLVRDADTELNEQDYERALKVAARVLSKRTPCYTFVEQTGDGTTFQWALPWIPDFSIVSKVEYPFDSAEQEAAELIDGESFDVYEKTAGAWWFRCLDFIPASGAKIRYTYTSPHTISDTVASCTIANEADEDSVLYCAAHLCLMQLSVRAIAVGNPSLGADIVSYQTRSGEYERRGQTYLKMSGLASFLEEETLAAGGWVRAQSVRRDSSGTPWSTHPQPQVT